MKTIMIQDTVYNGLSEVKGEKSFSELLDEMLESFRNSRAYKMALLNTIVGTLTDEEAKRAHENIRKLRANFRVRI